LIGTFGETAIAVPRARLATTDGKTTKWASQMLRAARASGRRADRRHVSCGQPTHAGCAAR
jgi:putative transposase